MTKYVLKNTKNLKEIIRKMRFQKPDKAQLQSKTFIDSGSSEHLSRLTITSKLCTFWDHLSFECHTNYIFEILFDAAVER